MGPADDGDDIDGDVLMAAMNDDDDAVHLDGVV